MQRKWFLMRSLRSSHCNAQLSCQLFRYTLQISDICISGILDRYINAWLVCIASPVGHDFPLFLPLLPLQVITGYAKVERALSLVAFFRTCFSVFSFWRCHLSFVLMQKCFWRFLRFLPATLRAEFLELFVGLPRYFMAAITSTRMYACMCI